MPFKGFKGCLIPSFPTMNQPVRMAEESAQPGTLSEEPDDSDPLPDLADHRV